MSLGGFNVDFIMRLPRTKDEIYDREDEINLLTDLVKRNQNVLIYGIRRSGKTTLLYALKYYVEENEELREKYIPIIIAMESFTGSLFSEFVKVYIDPLKEVYPLKLRVKDFARSILERISSRLRYLKIKGLLEIELRDNVRVAEAIHEVLDLPDVLGEELGKTIIACIDEFQVIGKLSQVLGIPEEEVYKLLRGYWQHHRNVVYVITGSRVSIAAEMSRATHPFYGMFYPIEVKPFTEKQTISFVKKVLNEKGYIVLKEALREVYRATNGIPAWVNLVGMKILEIAMKRNRKRIDVKIVREAINEALTSPYITRELERDKNVARLDETDEKILVHLWKKASPSEIAKVLGLSITTIYNRVRKLEDYGFLVKGNPTDPFLVKYLERKHRLDTSMVVVSGAIGAAVEFDLRVSSLRLSGDKRKVYDIVKQLGKASLYEVEEKLHSEGVYMSRSKLYKLLEELVKMNLLIKERLGRRNIYKTVLR